MRAPISSGKVILGIVLAAAVVVASWYAWRAWGQPRASQVIVTTDRTSYRQGDTVLVTIRNHGPREIEIYVPDLCAVGDFAALLQVRDQVGWHSSVHAAYADSLPGTIDISDGLSDVHATVAPGSSLEMQLPDILLYANRAGEETQRVAYYVIDRKQLVYSNEFTVAP